MHTRTAFRWHTQINLAHSNGILYIQMAYSVSNTHSIFRFTFIFIWNINMCIHIQIAFSWHILIVLAYSDDSWHIQMTDSNSYQRALSHSHAYEDSIFKCAFIFTWHLQMADSDACSHCIQMACSYSFCIIRWQITYSDARFRFSFRWHIQIHINIHVAY